MFNFKFRTSYAKLVIFCDKHVENSYVNHDNDFVKKVVPLICYLNTTVVVVWLLGSETAYAPKFDIT